MAQNPPNEFEEDEPTDPGLVAPAPASTAASAAPPAGPLRRMPELGALEPLMKDPTITEILVNDVRNVMIERDGKMSFSGMAIGSIDDLNRLARNILDVTGRILSPDQPYVDLMLPDGSRVNIVGPPLTLNGPCFTLRKAPSRRLAMDDLVGFDMLSKKMATFLQACVVGKLNILVSGGTDTGKTTLLNTLAAFVPKGERIVVIEDTPEILLDHANSVKLQTKPQMPASPPIGARELVANAMRMRPDRVIVGECRRGEAFDMLQAMNTGHSGSMTSLHANDPRDALTRLETLCMLAGSDLPLQAIRRQIHSAIDLVVQVKRFRNGKRRVTALSEVTGMEGEVITMQEIFRFELPSKVLNPAVEVQGTYKATGFVPTFIDRLNEQGVDIPGGFFG
jgi:pilus assembly protein CpaF